MSSDASSPSTTERLKRPTVEAITLIATTGVIVALLALTIVVVNRENSEQVAQDARTAILAEGTLSAAAATSNVGARALLTLRLENASDSVDTALSEDVRQALDGTIEALHDRSSLLASGLTSTEQTAVADALSTFGEATTALTTAIDDASIDRAEAARAAQRVAYENLEGQIVAIRDLRTENVLLAEKGLGRLAEATRFVVIFFMPLMVFVAYRRASRRREAQRRLEEDLERQRDLTQARDEFIAELSHELRTPLTGIYGFALAIQEVADLSDEDQELVVHIVNDAAELKRMVDDLITAGRMTAGTLAISIDEFSLKPLAVEVAAVFELRDLRIAIEIQDVVLRADPRGVRQILMNLVSNAATYGGDEISIEATTEGSMAVIRVVDNGPGVPEEVLPRLFNRYLHGGDRALLNGSIGLGTAVAFTYAESLGGTIEYRRVHDLTVFEVHIPAAIGASIGGLEGALV